MRTHTLVRNRTMYACGECEHAFTSSQWCSGFKKFNYFP